MSNNNSVLYVVSGCLAGLFCRYDGGSNPCPEVCWLYREGKAVAICPESLSGLPVPRLPCEQLNGRIISSDGRDLTREFERGAELALLKALATNCRKAILKSNSPSCGNGRVYDGSFSHTLVSGNGLWTAKLLDAGFAVYDERNLPPELRNREKM